MCNAGIFHFGFPPVFRFVSAARKSDANKEKIRWRKILRWVWGVGTLSMGKSRNLSNDEGYGSENVTKKTSLFQTLSWLFQFALTVKCGCISLELNTWDDLTQVLKVREKFLHKTTHKGTSRLRSCSWSAKECTRKWAACAGLLLCLLNVLFFWGSVVVAKARYCFCCSDVLVCTVLIKCSLEG